MLVDGHIALLNKIFPNKVIRKLRPDPRVYCRVCDIEMAESVKGRGFLCNDCYRTKNRERTAWYYLRHPDRIRRYSREKYRENPERASACARANYVHREPQICIADGCDAMGHRHHPDYSKPMEIVWLCPLHHKAVHRGEVVV